MTSANERDEVALARLAARRRVLFVPISIELAHTLESAGEEFSGSLRLKRRQDHLGEADLIFTRAARA